MYCPEDYFKSNNLILQGISSRAAECMDRQRQLVAEYVRGGGDQEIRQSYEPKATLANLNHIITHFGSYDNVNPMVSVDKKQVETVVWANPSAWGTTNKMALKNMGVAEGEATTVTSNEADSHLLDLAPSGVDLFGPILVLAYGFETNNWGNNRDVLSGAIYHVALSWLKWNPYPGNIHYGEIVNTERVWSDDSARLVEQVTNINVKRSQLAHALEYSAKIHPYIGGLAGL